MDSLFGLFYLQYNTECIFNAYKTIGNCIRLRQSNDPKKLEMLLSFNDLRTLPS